MERCSRTAMTYSEINGFGEWVLTMVRSYCIVINRWQHGFRWTDLGKHRTVLIYVDFNAYLKLQPHSLRPSALGKSLRSAETFTFLLFVHFCPFCLLLIPLISLLVQCCCTRTLPKNVVGLPRWFCPCLEGFACYLKILQHLQHYRAASYSGFERWSLPFVVERPQN